jgi:transposase-like protein
MRKAYTLAQQQEAVALARVAGAELAAEQLGIDPRTVRKWLAAAGHRPELDGSASQWRSALELAQAKLSARLASGTVTRRYRSPRLPTSPSGNLRTIEDRNPATAEQWMATTRA